MFKKVLSAIVFLMCFSLSCSTEFLKPTNPSQEMAKKYLNIHKKILPIKSFVGLSKSSMMKICFLLIENGKAKKQCVERKVTTKASAVIVKYSDEKQESIILTANHFCKTRKGLVDVSPISAWSFAGKEYKNTKIIAQNDEHDMCLVSVKKLKGIPVEISKKDPEVGDRVFNVAAPGGVYYANLVPIMQGFFAGRDENIACYSLFSAPGSSGSAIFNHYGKLIGIVVAGKRGVSHITFGPPLNIIKDFISKNISN